MSLLAIWNVSENRCYQKLKVPLQDHILKFLKMLEFHQLTLR